MYFVYEIFLTKKHITKEEWREIIKIISSYNGFFKKWKIIVINDKNNIKYYIKTKCSLPITINKIDSILLKKIDNISYSKSNKNYLSIKNIDDNLIDMINYYEIKNKGFLECIEITLRKSFNNKINFKINCYVNKNNIIKKYRLLFTLPSNILSIDFNNNKRYFYKSAPKYLEINKMMHLLNTDLNSSILKVDTFPYLQGNFYLNQNYYNFDKHSIIIGSSGSGKSKFLSLLISNINKNISQKLKYKIVVIDPHAALEDDIGGISKVIDFKNKIDSIDLFMNKGKDVVYSTELLLELFASLIKEQYNSKLERVLRHSIYLLLINESFNFNNLRKLILDLEYRNSLIKKFKYNLPISVIDFFLSDFNELKTKSYGEAISHIIAFIDEMQMLPVFNEENNNNNLKDIIKNNFLTLFSLDKTKLGDKITKTISGLIMQQLFTIVREKEIDEHIIFVIDEVATIENSILSRLLSEARKYNLSLVLIGQYFNQISDNLRNSIFANVINYYIFRVSKLDANILVDSLNMKIPLDDTKERKIKLLTELNNRECIARIDSDGVLLPSFKGTTIDYKSLPRIYKQKENKIIKKNNNFIQNNDFKISKNINLKDILLTNSSSRKNVK